MKMGSFIDFENESLTVKALAEALTELSVDLPDARVALRDNKLFLLWDNHGQEKLF